MQIKRSQVCQQITSEFLLEFKCYINLFWKFLYRIGHYLLYDIYYTRTIVFFYVGQNWKLSRFMRVSRQWCLKRVHLKGRWLVLSRPSFRIHKSAPHPFWGPLTAFSLIINSFSLSHYHSHTHAHTLSLHVSMSSLIDSLRLRSCFHDDDSHVPRFAPEKVFPYFFLAMSWSENPAVLDGVLHCIVH